MMDAGYFQVYTGNGKGKTTAAIGLAIRALGAGMSVYIGQFIKGMRYSEIATLESLAATLGPGRLVVEQYGRGCFILRDPDKADIDLASDGLARAREAMRSGRYALVILDELNVAVSVGVVTEADALSLVAERPPELELVVTGRYATEAMMAAADLVTEMREIKHYYKSGIKARTGIER
jgi:cob(I)alamin adenosyltransferase